MGKILIIAGHTDLNQSIVNKAIVNEVEAQLGANVEVRRLSELAPEGKFDVKAEQEALVSADVIVWQFPIFWYNAPSLFRKWMEDVLTYGFAYGNNVTTLHGKRLIISATAGAQEEIYKTAFGHTLEGLMHPFVDTSIFTGLVWQAPVFSYGALNNPSVSSEENSKHLNNLAANHAKRLVEAIKAAL